MNKLITFLLNILKDFLSEEKSEAVQKAVNKVNFIKKYLPPNDYSRPKILLKKVQGIVIHWVANPKTDAKFNWDYFKLREGGEYSFGSTQLIIDLNGDVIQTMPLTEMAYHVGALAYKEGVVNKLGVYPNDKLIGIECTHIDWAGTMTRATRNSLLKTCVYLCEKYNLTAKDVYKHYDITGKICPKYYVDNPKKWDKLKDEIDSCLLNV